MEQIFVWNDISPKYGDVCVANLNKKGYKASYDENTMKIRVKCLEYTTDKVTKIIQNSMV